jgi:hypothetical protein
MHGKHISYAIFAVVDFWETVQLGSRR